MHTRLLTGALVSAAIIVAATVAHAKNGMFFTKNTHDMYIFPPQRDQAPAPTAKQSLLYYGGSVLSSVKVYTVFWNFADPEVESGISDFYKDLANSSMMDWLDQYNTLGNAVNGSPGTGQHIGKGVFAGQYRIKPHLNTGTVDDKDIQVEIQRQIDEGALPKPDNNTLYMIHFPPLMSISAFGASSCREFCAYHFYHGDPKGYHWSYGVMPDIKQPGCDMGCAYGQDHFSSVTAISSHEFIEATTDPAPTTANDPGYPSAWNTSDGWEIGDLCAGYNNELKTSTGSYIVQSEFDNSIHSCSNQVWTSK